MSKARKALLRVEHLHKDFPDESRKFWKQDHKMVRAVDDVSFHIDQGETLAVVGESGCGKTTLARSILQICKPTAGKIYFDDVELTNLPAKNLRQQRSRMQMIFQNPTNSLNPRMHINEIIAEGMQIQGKLNQSAIQQLVDDLLEKVQLHSSIKDRYPHEFSSGQRQRIGIARALSMNPQLIICDEPISALDISIQAQMINLLIQLQNQHDLTYLYITHDLAMVQYISNRVAVMYMGKFVEMGNTSTIFADPIHPYTQALLSTMLPSEFSSNKHIGMIAIIGEKPDREELSHGCRFAQQCPIAMQKCFANEPEYQRFDDDHFVACHRI
ncbi:MAG: ATP-binding cassette domain-containing protein [Anaerolineaceae bacterium]|nr:ATP-binding cassette domain-containing protein [Anaerolineaceae bacterium]